MDLLKVGAREQYIHLSPVKCNGAAIRKQPWWHYCIKQLSTPMIISAIWMQRSSEQDAGIATQTGLWGKEGREMSLNNIKSPQPLETGSKLLHTKNSQIEFSEYLSMIIQSYFTQLQQKRPCHSSVEIFWENHILKQEKATSHFSVMCKRKYNSFGTHLRKSV